MLDGLGIEPKTFRRPCYLERRRKCKADALPLSYTPEFLQLEIRCNLQGCVIEPPMFVRCRSSPELLDEQDMQRKAVLNHGWHSNPKTAEYVPSPCRSVGMSMKHDEGNER